MADRKLFDACASDDLRGTEEALKNGANPDCRNIFGNTPLHHIAFSGDNTVEYPPCNTRKLVSLLLESGADINAVNHIGRTALHVAIMFDAVREAECLLEHGADMDCADTHGMSPRDLVRERNDHGMSNLFKREDARREKLRQKAEAEQREKEEFQEKRHKSNLAYIDTLMKRKKK